MTQIGENVVNGSRYRLGVDVGGTFTDFTLMDEASGRLSIFKTPSTPESPHRAVIDGVTAFVAEEGISAEAIAYFVHGTTIAVNTVVERDGAPVGLFVTNGFRDLLTLGRARLSETYSFLAEKPAPLVPRQLVCEIGGRMLATGEEQEPLDETEIRRQAARLRELGVEAIAVCLLHSFKNPEHEQRAKAVIEEACPELYVRTSAEVWPQMREYERALVTVIDAYVGPRMERYFDNLLTEASVASLSANLFITKSNGGVMTARSARERPVETLVSGPASGVTGARYMGQLAGFERLIALDMGGTSTEVAVVDQEIVYSTDNTVGDFQVVIPAVDVSSIGAGGGSIAWTDPSGVLKVGPHSAGAAPGPACYGLGGTEPTITDAYVILGIIDPDRFLGGRIKLRKDLALSAVSKIADVLDEEVVAAAESILRVATSNMYSTLVPLMAQKGVDISEFSLLTYGGAGPTHGFLLAREVGIDRVVVPPHPGTLSALGCLVADVKSDFIRTVNLEVDPSGPDTAAAVLSEHYESLEQEARQWLLDENVGGAAEEVSFSADMRFKGQAFEIEVAIDPGWPAAPHFGERFLEAFYQRYRELYAVGDLSGVVEVVNARASGIGATHKPALQPLAREPQTGSDATPAEVTRTSLFLDGQTWDAPVFDRDRLTRGHRIEGPAIVVQYDSTVFIPPGARTTVDSFGNLIGELNS